MDTMTGERLTVWARSGRTESGRIVHELPGKRNRVHSIKAPRKNNLVLNLNIFLGKHTFPQHV